MAFPLHRLTRASPRLISLVQHAVLPVWFAAMLAVHLATTSTTSEVVGLDATIYYRGAHAWLSGGDPWAAYASMGSGHYHFAGLPPTIELLAPFTLLPERAFVVLTLAATFVAGIYTLRRLHLPGLWLLFPPIAQALISGNPQLIVLALLLAEWPFLKALAVMLKIYAVVPLAVELRFRALAVTLTLLAISVVLAPSLWWSFLSRFVPISQRLSNEAAGGFSAWGLPLSSVLLVAVALLVLFVLDRKSAAWLAVPALWPASQLHYSALALPVITPVMAFALAIPQHAIPPAVVVALALWRIIQVVRRGHPGALSQLS